jgi:hypothetical protein
MKATAGRCMQGVTAWLEQPIHMEDAMKAYDGEVQHVEVCATCAPPVFLIVLLRCLMCHVLAAAAAARGACAVLVMLCLARLAPGCCVRAVCCRGGGCGGGVW